MKPARILFLILYGCLVSVAWGQRPACTNYTSWAQFHNRNMERWNPCEKVLKVHNVGKMVPKWSYAFGGGRSSPAVANGVVYVGSDDYNVYALNAKTGAELWSDTTGFWVESSPVVANGVVYINGDDFNVYAFGLK